jgi:prepilin-type N-terminal cleavage/methylation domain-containing protein
MIQALTMNTRLRRRRDDDGFTLMELLISVGLFAIIMTIVGSVILSSLGADRTVRTVTTTTTEGQLVVNVIEEAVRNSTAVSIATASDGVSVFATVRSTVGGSAACVAWFYDSETETVYQRRAAAAITAPTPGAVGDTWTRLGGSIVPDVDSTGTPYPLFVAQGTRGITVRFAVDGESGPESLFITSATGRAPQSNASPSCY